MTDLPQQDERTAHLQAETQRLQAVIARLTAPVGAVVGPAGTPNPSNMLMTQALRDVRLVRATCKACSGSWSSPDTISEQAIAQVERGIRDLIPQGYVCLGDMQIDCASTGNSSGVYTLYTVIQKMIKMV